MQGATNMQGTSDVSKAKLTNEDGEGYGLSDSVKRGKKKYKDVADAAQTAFESAAHAAEAARAAVELSQFSPRGPDNQGNIGGENSSNGSESKKLEQEQEGTDDFSGSEGDVVRSESKRSMSDSEEIIDDIPVMSFREDPVKLLEKDTVIYDSEEETQSSVETNTITKFKDEQNLMVGSNRADTRQLDRMVHSIENPIMHKADLKGPVSVRTRQVRGY